jgi:hypothetical protein
MGCRQLPSIKQLLRDIRCFCNEVQRSSEELIMVQQQPVCSAAATVAAAAAAAAAFLTCTRVMKRPPM